MIAAESFTKSEEEPYSGAIDLGRALHYSGAVHKSEEELYSGAVHNSGDRRVTEERAKKRHRVASLPLALRKRYLQRYLRYELATSVWRPNASYQGAREEVRKSRAERI